MARLRRALLGARCRVEIFARVLRMRFGRAFAGGIRRLGSMRLAVTAAPVATSATSAAPATAGAIAVLAAHAGLAGRARLAACGMHAFLLGFARVMVFMRDHVLGNGFLRERLAVVARFAAASAPAATPATAAMFAL